MLLPQAVLIILEVASATKANETIMDDNNGKRIKYKRGKTRHISRSLDSRDDAIDLKLFPEIVKVNLEIEIIRSLI